jgi:predicted secreted protein
MLFRKQILFSLVAALPVMANATPAEQLSTASVNAHVSVEIPQDEVHAQLYVEETGSDRAALASRVNATMLEAVHGVPSGVTVKTGNYRSYPLYDRNQHVSGYRVRADLSLESKDFDAFSKVLTKLSGTLSVQDVNYSVSDDAMKAAKAKLLTQVAGEFRSEAEAMTHAFGFGSYDIKDLNVNYDSGMRVPVVMRAMAMAAPAPAAPQVPASVEPGTATVSATANGSISLH